jgi:enoyl-CoA hydratase/carnithine racemase
MSDDAVRYDIEDGIATITLNRPDMRNAVTQEISSGLLRVLPEIADSDARCVVVEGAGGSFCAGGDINAMMQGLSGDISLKEKVDLVVEETSRAITRVYEFKLPVIAKIDGPAFGAGANLATACDVQLAHEDAQISFGFRQVGLNVDSGTSYLLPRIVGENTAKELLFTGRMVPAEEAADMGLFNRVYADGEFEDGVAEFVEQVATGPTIALSNSKRLVRQGLESTLEQAMTNEAAAQAVAFESHDHEEGATAFIEKRDAEFEGR